VDFQVYLNLLGRFLVCVLLESFIKFQVDPWFMIVFQLIKVGINHVDIECTKTIGVSQVSHCTFTGSVYNSIKYSYFILMMISIYIHFTLCIF